MLVNDQSVLVQDSIVICDFATETMMAMNEAIASPAAMKTMKAMKNAKKDLFVCSTQCLLSLP